MTERKKVWLAAIEAYTRSDNSVDVFGAIKWADDVLRAFDDRFNKQGTISGRIEMTIGGEH